MINPQRYRFRPEPDYPEDKTKENIARFKKNFSKTLEMLEEIKQRIPWQRELVGGLISQVEQRGRLSPKQRGFVTSLYLDSIVTSDAYVRRQVRYRKLCLRLSAIEHGSFIKRVLFYTDSRPFTQPQMDVVKIIADKNAVGAAKIKLEDFDGWGNSGLIKTM